MKASLKRSLSDVIDGMSEDKLCGPWIVLLTNLCTKGGFQGAMMLQVQYSCQVKYCASLIEIDEK